MAPGSVEKKGYTGYTKSRVKERNELQKKENAGRRKSAKQKADESRKNSKNLTKGKHMKQ